MDLRALGYFVACYDAGSISRAARQSHVAQPSVSQALQHLEAELQTKLFERSVKGLTPTPAGMALAAKARTILAEIASIRASFRMDNVPQVMVRLFVHPTIALKKLSHLIAAISTDRGLDIRLIGDRHEADLAIVPSEGGANEQPLWTERYDLLVPAHHPLARQDRIHLSDLCGARFIARCACERPQILPMDLVRPVIVAQVHDEASAAALVASGIGLAVAPGYDSSDPHVVARQVEGFAVERRIVAMGHPAWVERARVVYAGD